MNPQITNVISLNQFNKKNESPGNEYYGGRNLVVVPKDNKEGELNDGVEFKLINNSYC